MMHKKKLAIKPATEPIILVKHQQGFRLEEGMHRTIQRLLLNPEGYDTPAWVAEGRPY